MRLSLASLALVLVSLAGMAEAAPRALAQAPAAGESGGTATAGEQGKAPHKAGLAHYKLDEWKEAMDEFKTAYRLYPDPTFFYNIALCHRKLGENGEALSFYKKYLREKPDATNRGEVERRIAELEPIVAAEAK